MYYSTTEFEEEKMTLDDVAEIIGLTKGRISQLLKGTGSNHGILEKLRIAMESETEIDLATDPYIYTCVGGNLKCPEKSNSFCL